MKETRRNMCRDYDLQVTEHKLVCKFFSFIFHYNKLINMCCQQSLSLSLPQVISPLLHSSTQSRDDLHLVFLCIVFKSFSRILYTPLAIIFCFSCYCECNTFFSVNLLIFILVAKTYYTLTVHAMSKIIYISLLFLLYLFSS